METTKEKPDHEIARDECEAFIAGLSVTLELAKPTHSMEPLGEGKPWEHIHWSGKLKRNHAEIAVNYSMGIGNYDKPKLQAWEYNADQSNFGPVARMLRDLTKDMQANKPNKGIPTLCDILGCYCRDAIMANGVTREDFAAELGYDVDSIKSRKTWEACRDTYDNLRKLGLSHAEIDKVAEFANRF